MPLICLVARKYHALCFKAKQHTLEIWCGYVRSRKTRGQGARLPVLLLCPTLPSTRTLTSNPASLPPLYSGSMHLPASASPLCCVTVTLVYMAMGYATSMFIYEPRCMLISQFNDGVAARTSWCGDSTRPAIAFEKSVLSGAVLGTSHCMLSVYCLSLDIYH